MFQVSTEDGRVYLDQVSPARSMSPSEARSLGEELIGWADELEVRQRVQRMEEQRRIREENKLRKRR